MNSELFRHSCTSTVCMVHVFVFKHFIKYFSENLNKMSRVSGKKLSIPPRNRALEDISKIDKNLNMPGPSRLLRSALKRKANPEHNSKKIWAELNMPDGCEFLGQNVFSLPEKLLKHSTKMKPSPLVKPKPDKAFARKSIFF